MADVSKIQIGSTTYNIKDATARAAAEGKADLDAPVFTGRPSLDPNNSSSSIAVTNNSTTLATTEFVQKHAPLHLIIPIEAGSAITFNDSRITSRMRVCQYIYVNPNAIGSTVTAVTSDGTVSLTGTFLASTTLYLDLVDMNY